MAAKFKGRAKNEFIVEGAQQKFAFWARWDHIDVIGEKWRCHIDDTWEGVDKQQE